MGDKKVKDSGAFDVAGPVIFVIAIVVLMAVAAHFLG